MRTKFCITFAGVPGSSKSPIAHHIGWNLGLPIFNNDTLRTEVKEDLLEFDIPEYEKRRDDRVDQLMSTGKSFIYDASVDRKWGEYGKKLEDAGFEHFIISLDLSRELLAKIYEVKGYTQFAALDDRIPEHEEFLAEFGNQVNLHITDAEFPDRLEISLDAVREWIEATS